MQSVLWCGCVVVPRCGEAGRPGQPKLLKLSTKLSLAAGGERPSAGGQRGEVTAGLQGLQQLVDWSSSLPVESVAEWEQSGRDWPAAGPH